MKIILSKISSNNSFEQEAKETVHRPTVINKLKTNFLDYHKSNYCNFYNIKPTF